MSPADWWILGATLATVGTLLALKVWTSKP